MSFGIRQLGSQITAHRHLDIGARNLGGRCQQFFADADLARRRIGHGHTHHGRMAISGDVGRYFSRGLHDGDIWQVRQCRSHALRELRIRRRGEIHGVTVHEDGGGLGGRSGKRPINQVSGDRGIGIAQ